MWIMLRKCVGAILVGLLVVSALQSNVFAQRGQGEGKGPRAENRENRPERRGELRERLRERRQEFVENLPEKKREAIKALLEKSRERIQKVRQNEDLTREQKRGRIQAIREKTRERIRKIIGKDGGPGKRGSERKGRRRGPRNADADDVEE